MCRCSKLFGMFFHPSPELTVETRTVSGTHNDRQLHFKERAPLLGGGPERARHSPMRTPEPGYTALSKRHSSEGIALG